MNLTRGSYQFGFLAIVLAMMIGSSAFGQSNDVRPLPTDKIIEREMTGKETHIYKIGLKKGELFQVHVEQKGIDVVLKFLDEAGRTLFTWDMPTGKKGPEAFCHIASEDGNHTLEISGFDKKAEKGIYTIKREPPTMCHYIEPDVVYGHKDGLALTMDVYRPQSRRNNGAAILYMVSGGWFSRWQPPEQRILFYHPYLEKGYTVIAVRHGSSPRYSIPDIVSDVRRAVRFVRQNAKRLRVDPDRLGVIGASAGGHLSLMLGTTGDDGVPDAKDDLNRISSRVAAVVAFVPPTDLRLMVWGASESLPFYKNLVPALNMSVKEAGQYSPLVHVTKDDAPSLVIVGAKDKQIPPKHSRWIDEAFRKKGVPHKLIVFPDAGHRLRSEINRATTIREAIAWFDRFLSKRKK